MRLIYKLFVDPQTKYEEGVVFESNLDGSNRRTRVGTPPPPSAIRRVPVVVEVSYDDNPETMEKVRAALEKISEQLSAATH